MSHEMDPQYETVSIEQYVYERDQRLMPDDITEDGTYVLRFKPVHESGKILIQDRFAVVNEIDEFDQYRLVRIALEGLKQVVLPEKYLNNEGYLFDPTKPPGNVYNLKIVEQQGYFKKLPIFGDIVSDLAEATRNFSKTGTYIGSKALKKK